MVIISCDVEAIIKEGEVNTYVIVLCSLPFQVVITKVSEYRAESEVVVSQVRVTESGE